MPRIERRKRRTSRKSSRNTETSKVKVYMPYKNKEDIDVKRRKKKSFFRSKKNRSESNSNIRRRSKFGNVFFYIFLIFLFVGLLYLSTLFITITREGDSNDNGEYEYVIGLEKVPVYPGSEFVFKNSMKEASVANFLSSGNSAYRLPSGVSLDEVFEFYNKELTSVGWTFVLSVEVGSEEMKSGEYWIKDGEGLRIYSKFNDIWYELITETDAMTGLRARVIREVERDLLLKDENSQDLLPDYPWSLDVPKEYIISYSVSSFENMRSVQFQRIGTEEKTIVVPVGNVGSDLLDNFLRSYIEILNEEDGTQWGITNTVIMYTDYGQGLRGTISTEGGNHTVLVIPNTYDKVMYVVDSNTADDPFLEYILDNMKPQGLKQN